MIFCDGAAGTQVPSSVIDKMAEHLRTLGSTNVTSDHLLGCSVTNVVKNARNAAKDLLGANSSGEIVFGLNSTNLMFHLARSIENSVLRNNTGNIKIRLYIYFLHLTHFVLI